MGESAEKIVKPSASSTHRVARNASFFGKTGEEHSFFHPVAGSGSFFSNHPIQAKLNVSKPGDPQEREADQMAERVMNMPEPSVARVEERKEEVQRKEEDREDKVHTMPVSIQCMAGNENKEEEKVQRQEEKEKEQHEEEREGIPVQAKFIDTSSVVQREETKEEEKIQPKCEACAAEEKKKEEQVQSKIDDSIPTFINRKTISLHGSDVIQCSGRGPPESSIQFEKTLTDSKGMGSPLPEGSRIFMESRFGADFSGVRIHTGSTSENLNGQVHAQAFTHGNDIYFNSDKYSPNTTAGNLLLAHELTHTIQQGASKQAPSTTANSPSSIVAKSLVSRNHIGKKHASVPPFSGVLHSQMNAFSFDRKDEHDDHHMPVGEKSLTQTQPGMSKWSVNAAGHLQQKTADNKMSAPIPAPEVQVKDEEQKEEKDKEHSISPAPVHRKISSAVYARKECCEGATTVQHHEEHVQLHTEFSDSSLNVQTGVSLREEAVQQNRGPPLSVQGETNIHRSVVDDALNYVGSLSECIIVTDLDASKRCALRKAQEVALHIPGYKALRVVLGEDPITGERIVRNGRNFIEAAFDIMPGGDLLYQKLDEIHKLDAAAAWIDGKIAVLERLVNGLFNAFTTFWNGLGLLDLRSPMDVLRRGANIVLGFINQVISFAVNAATELLRMVKDYLLGKIVDFIKEQTTAYPLLTVILGKDPITDQVVQRNGTNILNALLELGGEEGKEQRRQMQETGSFQRVANYIDRGIAIFSGAYDQIVQGFHNIWNNVSISSLMDPVGTFRMIYQEFAAPVQKVWDFVKEVGAVILKFIKEVLMVRLSAWARQQKGYTLVTVLIGKDPFTNEVVPRSVENIIHGFMSLMDGGEEQFQQMKQTGAIAKATAEIDAAVTRLNMTPAYVVQLFIDLWNSFSLNDLIHPIAAFQRIIARFGEPIGRLLAFVVEIIRIVIHVILQIMNFPFDLINNIITKAMMAFELIKKDPVAFLKNLLSAIKQGFIQFFDNILTHLWNGLKTWFLGEVQAAGIPIPTDFSILGIIKWLLAVLDITMEKIWKKLEERIGKEKVAKIKRMIALAEKIAGAVGEAYQFMKDVQERGFMTVMVEKIKEKMSNAWDMVLGAVQSFVMDQIIKKITQKLLTMLDPTGIMAVVNSAIALYKAIQSFIRYLRQMLEIVNSFVEGVLQIAQGVIQGAADFLERAMARGIPIVIGFLANQVGLNLSERLKDALEKVRDWADQALTWLVDRVVTLVEKLIEMGKSAIRTVAGWLGIRKPFKDTRNEDHELYFEGSEKSAQLFVASYNPRTIPTLLTAVSKIIDKPANLPHKQKYEDAKTLSSDIDAIKVKLADPDNANADKDNEEMNKKLQELADKLPPLMTMVGGTEPPPLVKPEFANGVKASGFEVAYIKKGRTGGGSAAGTNSGATLVGWPRINQAGLSANNAWVKMHLLHDDLGGPALDSNLTPATGRINGAFYREVESKALSAVSGGKTIWYKTTIGYHGGADADYANSVQMEFGPYDFNNTTEQWERKDAGTEVEGEKVGASHSETPTLPDFTGSALPNLNELGRVKVQNIDPSFTRQFAEFVVDVNSDTTFTQSNMQSKLDQGHQQRTLKVENYESQRDTLVAAFNVKYVLK